MSTRTHLTLATLSLALAFTLGACDRRDAGESGDLSPETGNNTPAPTDTPPSDPASGTATSPDASAAAYPDAAATVSGTAAGSLTSADNAFLAEATRSNEEEISTTQLGMERGNAKNKELSRMLNSDHVALRGQVAALVPNAPTPPAVPAPAALADLRGEAFDGRLLATYVEQHEMAIRKFTDASNNPALSEPVRTLAKNTLPKLQAHLQAVKAAQGATSTAGAAGGAE